MERKQVEECATFYGVTRESKKNLICQQIQRAALKLELQYRLSFSTQKQCYFAFG